MKYATLSTLALLALTFSAGCEWRFSGATDQDAAPVPGQPGAACASNADCESGAICDAQAGVTQCTEAPVCDTSEACDVGFSCDPRDTCVYTGECSAEAPACNAGPGLYCNEARGTCEANDPATVACEAIIDQAQCDERADCAPVYAGIDCTTPNGDSCTANAADCTCASFVFDVCATL